MRLMKAPRAAWGHGHDGSAVALDGGPEGAGGGLRPDPLSLGGAARGREPHRVLGAGGGGYLLVYCDFGTKHAIAATLEQLGGRVVDFTFDHRGLQTWEVKSHEKSRMVVPQYSGI